MDIAPGRPARDVVVRAPSPCSSNANDPPNAALQLARGGTSQVSSYLKTCGDREALW